VKRLSGAKLEEKKQEPKLESESIKAQTAAKKPSSRGTFQDVQFNARPFMPDSQVQPTPKKHLRPIKKILCDLFQHIAETESNIELLRLQLARVENFKPRALFHLIDIKQSNSIDPNSLLEFMQSNFIKVTSIEIVTRIIGEFDSDEDGKMTYDEFLNMLIPAANASARTYCLYNKRHSRKHDEPSREVVKVACKILELERDLAAHKMEAQMDLADNDGFTI
jgi:hypothetical protein